MSSSSFGLRRGSFGGSKPVRVYATPRPGAAPLVPRPVAVRSQQQQQESGFSAPGAVRVTEERWKPFDSASPGVKSEPTKKKKQKNKVSSYDWVSQRYPSSGLSSSSSVKKRRRDLAAAADDDDDSDDQLESARRVIKRREVVSPVAAGQSGDDDDDDDEPAARVSDDSSEDPRSEVPGFEALAAETKALVMEMATRIDPAKQAIFIAHYSDRWIARNLANNSSDPAAFVLRFRSQLETKFGGGRERQSCSSSCSSWPPSPAVAAPSSPVCKPAAAATCDRCDGRHETSACPHFRKERDDHPDATRKPVVGGKSRAAGRDGGNAFLREATVAPQPGDGSCLFHSLLATASAGGLLREQSASGLRAELMDWLVDHEDAKIADTPVRDWVKWDSGCSVPAYARRMRHYGWGGGIEMAAFAHRFRVDVHVYETTSHATWRYKRISRFEKQPRPPGAPQPATLTLLYRGGVHYDALFARKPPVEFPIPTSSKFPIPHKQQLHHHHHGDSSAHTNSTPHNIPTSPRLNNNSSSSSSPRASATHLAAADSSSRADTTTTTNSPSNTQLAAIREHGAHTSATLSPGADRSSAPPDPSCATPVAAAKRGLVRHSNQQQRGHTPPPGSRYDDARSPLLRRHQIAAVASNHHYHAKQQQQQQRPAAPGGWRDSLSFPPAKPPRF